MLRFVRDRLYLIEDYDPGNDDDEGNDVFTYEIGRRVVVLSPDGETLQVFTHRQLFTELHGVCNVDRIDEISCLCAAFGKLVVVVRERMRDGCVRVALKGV
jgi:hypothetical protein